MSRIETQRQEIGKRNGFHAKTFQVGNKKVPTPLTSRMEALLLLGYWFTAARRFLVDAQVKPMIWKKVWHDMSSNKWHFTDDDVLGIDSRDLGFNTHFPLDAYLALPPFHYVEEESSRTDNADRFSPEPWAITADLAFEVRKLAKADGGPWPRGGIVCLYSDKQTVMDGGQRFELYLRGFVSRWDKMCGMARIHIWKWAIPHAHAYDKFATQDQAYKLWQMLGDIQDYIAAESDVLDSMKGWTDYVEESYEAVKSTTETVIEKGSEAVGDVAAWTADQAGKALGGGISSFLDNVGLWGLGFVALLIATR